MAFSRVHIFANSLAESMHSTECHIGYYLKTLGELNWQCK